MFRRVQPWLLAGLTLSAAVDVKEFDWETITPSHNLTYTTCYGELKCARLIVPLDWQDETNPHTVALAITKLPAKVPEDDPTFGGTIFTNPGGPGGTGVGFILRKGQTLQDISGGNKNYEILSWDPRGVGFTSPKADCYQGDIAARDLADIEEKAIGPLDSSEYALKSRWARTKAFGQLCQESAKNASSILPYATTPSVVNDMVAILDQIHAIRGSKEPVLLGDDTDAERRLELRKPHDETPRMLYWGFSYGSILGNTFASMYPGRVGRVIVDGIADADDYMLGTWLTNLQDTETLVDHFYKTCFEAGDCSLKRSSDSKWQDIKQRVDAFVTQTNESPISMLKNNKIAIITGSDLLSAFTLPVYSPLTAFRHLSELLSGAIEGNYTLLLADIVNSLPSLHDSCALANSSTIATYGPMDSSIAIKCGDGEDETHRRLPYFQSYVEELKSQSSTLGAYWATIRFACVGWTIRPKWRFTGPFTTPEPDSSLVAGKPAAPLLFLSSRLDPVTPLRNAVAMAAKHPGAAWVVQESTGHCALAVPSKCTKKIIQDYLEHGEVPKSGTSCPADCDPWHPCGEADAAMSISLVDEHSGLLQQRRLGI